MSELVKDFRHPLYQKLHPSAPLPRFTNVPVSVDAPGVSHQLSTALNYRLLPVDLYLTIDHLASTVFTVSSS